MIKYRNKDLTDVAPVKIDDIVVSPLQLNPVARQRAVNWGADFVRMVGGTRTVTITFALLDSSRIDREKAMQDIRDWCKVGNNTEYEMVLPQFEDRYLECVCTQLPENSFRKWWENKLKLVFTCYNNPYWTSSERIEAPCGTTFSVGGSAEPLITIERNNVGRLTNQTYSNGKQSMTFSTIPVGSMVIDLNRQTAAIGKTSFMKYYDPSSSWLPAKIGANQVITGKGTVKYRERWV